MPTNLPPDYYEIEKRFRSAETVDEKIEALQEMMSVVPKHKGTDHLRADLRRRLARLKEEALAHKSSARRDSAFRIARAGAGRAILAGPANTGKSALFNALTGANVAVSAAPHTTWEPEAGMLPIENLQVQMIDTPALSREYVEPQLKELLRKADVLLLVVDAQDDPLGQFEESTALLEEFRIGARQRAGRYPPDQSLVLLPILVLVNKCDQPGDEELYQLFCELLSEPWPSLPVSAASGRNLGRLGQEILARLDILRVYTRAPGREPDLSKPFVLKPGDTVEVLAGRIHKDILKNMKTARVWGKVVHSGQMVPRDYILQDGDVVEILT